MRTKLFLAAILMPWILASHGPSGGGTAAWQNSFDPTGGYDFQGSIGNPIMHRFVAAQSGHITKVQLYVTDAGSAPGTNVVISIYDASRAQLFVDGFSCTTTGWVEFPISSPVAVTAGTTYGVGFSGASALVASLFTGSAEDSDPGDPWYVSPNPFPTNPITATHGVGIYIVP